MKHDMKKLLLSVAFTAALFSPAPAQTPYQPDDVIMLQSCLETVRDINNDPEAGERASANECIGIVSDACQMEASENQSTAGMVMCGSREISWWDELLNSHYISLKDALGAEEFDKLRTAQRAWLAYRDAQCEFDHFYWRDGTIRSLFSVSCQLNMTAERALALGDILEWTSF